MTAKEILQQYVQKQEEVKKCEKIKEQTSDQLKSIAGDQLKKAQREANKARTELKPVELPLEYVLKELSNNNRNYVHCSLILYVEDNHFVEDIPEYDATILENKNTPCYASISIYAIIRGAEKELRLKGKTIVTPSALEVSYRWPINEIAESVKVGNEVREIFRSRVECEIPENITVTFSTNEILKNKVLYDIVMDYEETTNNNLGE